MSLIVSVGEPFPGSAFASPIYRIPAIARTGSGRLVVCYDVREDWRDLPADFDIAVRFSDDDGATWSEPRVLRRHEPGHGFGDASLTWDPASGTLLCWYVGSTGESYFSASAGGPSLELWLAQSHDDGETWTHRDMSELRPKDVAGWFCSSGNGDARGDGVVLQTIVERINDENYVVVAASRDSGERWELGEAIGPDCDESKILALQDGRLLLHARSQPKRREAWADGVGEKFTEPLPNTCLTDPACNGGLARVGRAIVASMCDDPVDRTRLALHVSLDHGETWSDSIVIDTGAAAYSAVVAMGDNRVGVVWEADDYRSIVFESFALSDLGVTSSGWHADAVRVVPREGTPGAAKPPVVNS